MKLLLIVSAAFEAPVGLLLLLLPGIVFSVLLGASIETPAAFVAARLAGAAILALAIACWQARNEKAVSVVTGMLFYNLAATVVLAYASIRLGMNSVMIWPAMVLHSVLAVWCALTVWAARKKAA